MHEMQNHVRYTKCVVLVMRLLLLRCQRYCMSTLPLTHRQGLKLRIVIRKQTIESNWHRKGHFLSTTHSILIKCPLYSP